MDSLTRAPQILRKRIAPALHWSGRTNHYPGDRHLYPNRCEPMRTGVVHWSWGDLCLILKESLIFETPTFRICNRKFPEKSRYRKLSCRNSEVAMRCLLKWIFNQQNTNCRLGDSYEKNNFFEPVIETSWHALKEPLATRPVKKKQAGYSSVIWNVTQEIAGFPAKKTRIARFFWPPLLQKVLESCLWVWPSILDGRPLKINGFCT